MYSGYVQTILFIYKAILGNILNKPCHRNLKTHTLKKIIFLLLGQKDIIEFSDYGDHMYVMDKKEISNYDSLGVITASGNRVRDIYKYSIWNIPIHHHSHLSESAEHARLQAEYHLQNKALPLLLLHTENEVYFHDMHQALPYYLVHTAESYEPYFHWL